MVIGEIHSKGSKNEDGTFNFEFVASNMPPEAGVVIRAGIRAMTRVLRELADGHVVLTSDGKFAEQIEADLGKMSQNKNKDDE